MALDILYAGEGNSAMPQRGVRLRLESIVGNRAHCYTELYAAHGVNVWGSALTQPEGVGFARDCARDARL